MYILYDTNVAEFPAWLIPLPFPLSYIIELCLPKGLPDRRNMSEFAAKHRAITLFYRTIFNLLILTFSLIIFLENEKLNSYLQWWPVVIILALSAPPTYEIIKGLQNTCAYRSRSSWHNSSRIGLLLFAFFSICVICGITIFNAHDLTVEYIEKRCFHPNLSASTPHCRSSAQMIFWTLFIPLMIISTLFVVLPIMTAIDVFGTAYRTPPYTAEEEAIYKKFTNDINKDTCTFSPSRQSISGTILPHSATGLKSYSTPKTSSIVMTPKGDDFLKGESAAVVFPRGGPHFPLFTMILRFFYPSFRSQWEQPLGMDFDVPKFMFQLSNNLYSTEPREDKAGTDAAAQMEQHATFISTHRSTERGHCPTSGMKLGSCFICCENPANAIFLPCSHSGICESCATNILCKSQPCPLCRKLIITCLKIIKPAKNAFTLNAVNLPEQWLSRAYYVDRIDDFAVMYDVSMGSEWLCLTEFDESSNNLTIAQSQSMMDSLSPQGHVASLFSPVPPDAMNSKSLLSLPGSSLYSYPEQEKSSSSNIKGNSTRKEKKPSFDQSQSQDFNRSPANSPTAVFLREGSLIGHDANDSKCSHSSIVPSKGGRVSFLGDFSLNSPSNGRD